MKILATTATVGRNQCVNEPHPTYPNPTIAEVICDIHFRLAEGETWQADFFGKFVRAIQTEYPEVAPISELDIQFEVVPTGLRQKFVPSAPRMRFTHETRLLLLDFAENNMRITILPKYPTWTSVSQHVLWAWACLKKVVHPANLTRLGLRYINQIDRETPEQPAGAWLQAGDYIPPKVLESAPGFVSRTQVQLDAQNRVLTTVADVTLQTPEHSTAIIFDIDRITEQLMPVTDKRLTDELWRLHDDVWNIFFTAQTEKLRLLLERKDR
jgi:uncharacterized protein (TIGR04255 family)